MEYKGKDFEFKRIEKIKHQHHFENVLVFSHKFVIIDKSPLSHAESMTRLQRQMKANRRIFPAVFYVDVRYLWQSLYLFLS